MTCSSRLSSAVLVAIFVITSFGAQPAAQQPQPPRGAAPPASQPAPAEDAPIVRFAPEGIGLDEAVRLTLQYDANLRRQLAAADFSTGVAIEQMGPFDYTLQGGISYERRVQELSQSRKDSEQQKRDRLDQAISSNGTAARNAQALLPLLQQLQTSQPGQEPIAQIRAIDPSMADLLVVFNNLIQANANNPTLQASLIAARRDFINTSLGPNFQQSLQDQIDSYNAAVTQRANLGDAPTDEVFYNTKLQFQLSKLFRSGILFTPYIDGSSDGTNFLGKPNDAEFGGKGLKDQYTFHAGTGLTLPLLRGRGATTVAAGERIALIERDAAKLTAQHQASVSSLSTVFAYWDVRSAQENLAAVRRSADLQSNLLRLTQQLINGGELPGAELARSQAADARARAQLEDAQRQLHQARVALATAMGISATGDDDTLPLARDAFPAPPPAPALQGAPTLVQGSPERRLDLTAALREQEAGHVGETAATANVRSRLDLTANTFYTAIGENSVRRTISRWVGPSTQLSLQLEKPLGNNTLRGQLLERQADAKARTISANDLRRQIRLGVLQASMTLGDAVAQVQQAEAAVGFFRSIYDADIQRFQTGEATLIDTVITEQQQTEALFALTAARNQLAKVLAQLRFETGTLLPADQTVLPQNFITMPPVAGTPR